MGDWGGEKKKENVYSPWVSVISRFYCLKRNEKMKWFLPVS
jgi:hypothetical protein